MPAGKMRCANMHLLAMNKLDTKLPAAPIDPERRKLAKLTTEALIDEVIGLRADLRMRRSDTARVVIDVVHVGA